MNNKIDSVQEWRCTVTFQYLTHKINQNRIAFSNFVPIFKTIKCITMWVLVLLLLAGTSLIMVLTWMRRKKQTEEVEINYEMDEECCGAHEVCDKDSLLNADNIVVYYDDEELDVLRGKSPDSFTSAQEKQLADIFYTLRESDVAGWLRSLQLRCIQLPDELKEEALMIIRERRA